MAASKWIIKKSAGDAALAASELNISPTLSRVLINRGIVSFAAAKAFLNPELSSLEDIVNMKGVCEGFELIKDSIHRNEKILIYGDYDADGVMSTVILHKTLTELGGRVSYYIPDRELEGYGLNIAAVERIRKEGTDLLITCDNGIASADEVSRAKELGMRVIIIDHHEQGIQAPEADAVIDPKQSLCPYKFKLMCAAGISLRFAAGLYRYFGREPESFEELLSLAAIATFCDIVDLQGENRVIAKLGLKAINRGIKNTGLAALVKARGVSIPVKEYDIGFIIGPCINAAGRLERASSAVELFLTGSADYARELSENLAVINEERKKLTASAFDTALKIYQDSGSGDKVAVIYSGDIHESVAGIAAGRIKDRLHRPVIVLTDSLTEGVAKGSARSVEGYDIFGALTGCAFLLERFGGHTMAAGLSLKNENIDALTRELNRACTLTEEDLTEKITIDKQLDLADITFALAQELRVLAPFGKANHEPLFGTKGVTVDEVKSYPEKDTLRFAFKVPGTYRRITAVCFGRLDEFFEMVSGKFGSYRAQKIISGILRGIELKIDIIYSVGINEYNGNVSVNIKIKHFRLGE